MRIGFFALVLGKSILANNLSETPTPAPSFTQAKPVRRNRWQPGFSDYFKLYELVSENNQQTLKLKFQLEKEVSELKNEIKWLKNIVEKQNEDNLKLRKSLSTLKNKVNEFKFASKVDGEELKIVSEDLHEDAIFTSNYTTNSQVLLVHGDNNCEFFGLNPDQRTDYFVHGDNIHSSYNIDEKAWHFYSNKNGGSQWVGWRSSRFANRLMTATFEVKFLRTRSNTSNDGFKVYGHHYDRWLKDASADVGSWVSAEIVSPVGSEGDDYHIILIFDKAPVNVLIKDFVMSVCD